jgi:hypothetical protein
MTLSGGRLEKAAAGKGMNLLLEEAGIGYLGITCKC